MNVGKIIEKRRLELGYTLEEVGNAVGVGKSTVRKWETGYISEMRRDKIMKVANFLDINPLDLLGAEYKPNIADEVVTFPVIGEVAAGYDMIAIEDWQGDTANIPKEYLKGHVRDDFFVLKVIGDSMYPMYQNGDKVLVLKQSTLNNSGDVGVMLYDDDKATLKKVEFVQGEDRLKLIPINPMFPTQIIEGEQLEHCRVIGIPKLLIREI